MKREVSNKVRNKVEQAVLINYSKHSPSKVPLEDKRFMREYLKKREKLFFDLLKMPKKLFKGASILNLGCGTGEPDICYARWGGLCTLVDMNPISTKKAAEYFKKFNLGKSLINIQTRSLFNFSSNKKFDIVVSEGVLHHTEDPKRGFQILARHLKKDGFVVLQIGLDTVGFQRSLQRLVLDYLTDASEAQIVAVSKLLFSENLGRAHRFGGREINQIIYDSYVNPKTKFVNISEVFDWFKANNIRYYSSFPSIQIEGLINALHKDSVSQLISRNLFMLPLINFLFLAASEDDELFINRMKKSGNAADRSLSKLFRGSHLNNYEYGDNIDLKLIGEAFQNYAHSVLDFSAKKQRLVEDKINLFKNEILELFSVLKTRDLEKIEDKIKSLKVVFRGYSGVPCNYIVGQKK